MPGDTSVWKALRRKLIQMGAENAHVKVGVVGNGASEDREGITMAQLAAIHEFGSPAAGIPERSFIRFTVANQVNALNAQMHKVAHAIVEDKISVDRGLNVLGQWAQNAIKKSITEKKIHQGLSPVTIARKGSSTALIDTGRLLNAITYKVERGGGG